MAFLFIHKIDQKDFLLTREKTDLAELRHRIGLSRTKLHHLKTNGFCETSHGFTV